MASGKKKGHAMEKIRASYEINKNSAILAGRSEYGRVVVTVDPGALSPAQREELTKCRRTADGAVILLDSNVDLSSSSADPSLPIFCAESSSAVAELLDARIAIREARKLREQAQRVEYLESLRTPENWLRKRTGHIGSAATLFQDLRIQYPDLEDLDVSSTAAYVREISRPYASDDISLPAGEEENVRAAAQELADEINAPILADCRAKLTERYEALRAEADAAAETTKRRTDQITTWVQDHGSDNQQKRFSVGLLPEDEVVDALRAIAYAPLDAFDRYVRIKGADFCTCEYDPDLNYSVEDAASATAEEFERMEAIRALVPDAEITLRTHTGKCDSCEQTQTRNSIRVEIAVGEFSFSREYAA
jgi:hypothetical protein